MEKRTMKIYEPIRPMGGLLQRGMKTITNNNITFKSGYPVIYAARPVVPSTDSAGKLDYLA